MNVDAQWRADITRQMQESSKAQQETAVIIERIMGRLTSVEHWQEEEEQAKVRREERRNERVDKQPDSMRANIALLVTACTATFYLLTYVAQHWKP